MKEFYRIGTDGQVTTFDGSKLEALQEAVGGYITTAPVTALAPIPRNTVAYANDEGLIIGEAYNTRASFLCGTPLVGPVVIRATKKVSELLGHLVRS